ncbi:DUF2029 domain-containing protein [soil metagenome]
MPVRLNIRILAYALISLCAYLFIGYTVERHQFGHLIVAFGILFVTYFLMLRESHFSARHMRWGLIAAVLFRVSLLFAIPNLSDDFYRFIWDGNLFINGINPFLETPSSLVQTDALPFFSEILYQGLNSAEYYSVYPPICQYVFSFSALLFEEQLLGNVIMIRVFIILAELGTIWVLKKLLNHFRLNPTYDPTYVLFYALNPLVILELTGNLHFEGVMIFFLLFSFYLFLNNKFLWGAVFFTLAVNTKLIPLLLVPYLVFSLGWKRSPYFLAILGTGTLLLHLPFLNLSFVEHFSSSLGLYFETFEFNASIYYLVRWVGFQVKGYNIIATAGPYLAAVSTLIILIISWWFRHKKLKNLPFIYIAIMAIYYLFSTTVHPWYISSILAFVPLTGLLFPVAWSLMIPLTYITYISSAYTETLWIVALEYTVVILVIAYDYHTRQKAIPFKIKRLFGLTGKY